MALNHSGGLLDAAKKSRTSICRKCLSPLPASLPRLVSAPVFSMAHDHHPFLIFSAQRSRIFSRIPSVHHVRGIERRRGGGGSGERLKKATGDISVRKERCAAGMCTVNLLVSAARSVLPRVKACIVLACSCMLEMDVECTQQREELRWEGTK